MKTYKHSATFNSLKRTREQVAGNLTSAQYLNTLDMLLWKAMEPIALECSPFFYNYLAKCVAHQAIHPNSKYTSGDKTTLPTILFQALIESKTDPLAAFIRVRKLYINRGLLFGLVSTFLRTAEPYKKLQSAFASLPKVILRTRRAAIEAALGSTAPDALYSAIQQVEYWDNRARIWKNIIVEKYTRMALGQAQKTYVDFNHFVDLDDVSQIYLMVTSKAVDRCDARLGVLTTFIQNWLKGARSQVAELASGQGDESLEDLAEKLGDSMDLGAVWPDTTAEALQEISYKSQVVDPEGFVRMHLGIPQYVTQHDRQTLLSFAIQ